MNSSFKLLEYILISKVNKENINKIPIKLYEKDWISLDIFSDEVKNELNYEINRCNLKSIEEIKILNEYGVVHNLDEYYYASFVDNKKDYENFISIGGLNLIPVNYYYNCCSMNFKGSSYKIKQIHNSKIQNDTRSEYIFLEISYDYNKLKLECFKKS